MLPFNMRKLHNIPISSTLAVWSTLNSMLSRCKTLIWSTSCGCNKNFHIFWYPKIVLLPPSSTHLFSLTKLRKEEDEKWKRCMDGNRLATKGVRELFWSDYLIKIMIFHPFHLPPTALSLSTFCFRINHKATILIFEIVLFPIHFARACCSGNIFIFIDRNI